MHLKFRPCAAAAHVLLERRATAAPAKEKKDCFVLLSGQGDDDCVDYQPVIGVFSKWPPLVKKAQALMKQKGITLPCVDDVSGRRGTIPSKPFPAELKHAICIETVTDPASAHYGFTLYVQRKKAA